MQSAGGVKVVVRGFKGKDVITAAAEDEALDVAPDSLPFDMMVFAGRE